MKIQPSDVVCVVLMFLIFVLLAVLDPNGGDGPAVIRTEFTAVEEAKTEAANPEEPAGKQAENKPQPVLIEEPGTGTEALEVAEEDGNGAILEIPLAAGLQEDLYSACEEFGIDYYIMVALIERETNFQNIMGDGGRSYGYCQIQKRWWSGLMKEIGATDLTVPKDNFRTACAILSYLMKLYDGDMTDALTGYNTGHGGSSQYASGILAAAERWRAA